jgi:hypothetical protein
MVLAWCKVGMAKGLAMRCEMTVVAAEVVSASFESGSVLK